MNLVGDGGLARQIRDVIDSFNCYSISCGGRVQESTAWLVAFASLDSLEKREEAYDLLQLEYKTIGTLISPKATVSPTARIEQGGVILHDVFIGPGASLDVNVLVGTRAVVEHGSLIGQHSVVLTGAIVNGGVNIGCRVMIGSGAIILQDVAICDDVKIGAGSIITKNITEPGVYVGVDQWLKPI